MKYEDALKQAKLNEPEFDWDDKEKLKAYYEHWAKFFRENG